MTLVVSNLSVAFDKKQIFDEVGFTLKEGQIGCLLGQSGCGKTTVLRSLMGFCEPQSGCIILDNQKIFEANSCFVPAYLRQIGMVFQDYALFSHLTVAKNICFGIQKLPKAQQQQRLDELLALMDMRDFAKRYPHELSGGQQQRVALARALAPKPKLLLLDEPFSNLDVELRATLSFEIRRLLKSQNITAILVTHDQTEAFLMSDVVGVMAHGKLQQWDTPTTLYQKPATQAVASFVGEGVLLPIQDQREGDVLTALGWVACDSDGDNNNIHPSTKTHLLVRPEAVKVNDSGVPATLQRCDFRGSYWQAWLRLEQGEQLLMHLPIEYNYQIGQPLRVRASKGWRV